MPDHSTDTAPWLGASARFATTQWTAVLIASRDGPERRAALEKFCHAYWYPVYAFIRRRGSGADDARDLTQEFFARLIEKDWLAGVERRATRFSTMLLTFLTRFLVNEYERSQTVKRGAGVVPMSIDMARMGANANGMVTREQYMKYHADMYDSMRMNKQSMVDAKTMMMK